MHLQQGRLPIPTPVIMGHEAVGRIERLGEGLERDVLGQPLSAGDRVVWASNIPCGRCSACLLLGERTLCPDRKIYGINQRSDAWPHLSGGWADTIYLQPGSTLVRIPDAVRSEEVIALGCAGPTVVHGVLGLLRIQVGDVVAVQNPHFITRKQLKLYGSWAFAEAHFIDYVRTLELLRERHDLTRLVTRYALDQANDALADVAAGRCTKAVLRPAG